MKIFEILIFEFLMRVSLALFLTEIKQGRVISTVENDLLNEWNSFKVNQKKFYRNKTHESSRYAIFKQNILKINKQNILFHNGQSTYTAGVNQFTDMTENEFMSYVNRGVKRAAVRTITNGKTAVLASKSIPASIDYRTEGCLSEIKNQGTCGSCWSFAAACAIESYNCMTNGKLLDLSEQHLVDCVYLALEGPNGPDIDGCQGGDEIDAYNYVIKNGGIATEAGYPYTSGVSGIWSGKCKYNTSTNSGVQLQQSIAITNGRGNETALTLALANIGPIDVGFYVSSKFQSYSSGVFVDSTCGNNKYPLSPNHAVNLVGYGTSSTGQDYYILRNQWGTSWGMQGYMYFARDTIGNTNQCGIATWAVYPNVKKSNSTSQPTTTRQPSVQSTSTTRKPSVQSTSTTRKPSVQSTSTTRQPSSTTRSPTIITTRSTNNSWSSICKNGVGWYPNPGCQTVNYCSQTITNYYCTNGYLFDSISQQCKPASQVKCNPPVSVCSLGTGYYTLTGCVYVDYCKQQVISYYCNSGYLFDVTTKTCKLASQVKCLV